MEGEGGAGSGWHSIRGATYERGLRHSYLVIAACPGDSPPRFPPVGLLCHHLDPAPTSSPPSSTARPRICPSAPSGTPPVSPTLFSSLHSALQSSPYLKFVFRGTPRSFLDPIQGFPTFLGPSLAPPETEATTCRNHFQGPCCSHFTPSTATSCWKEWTSSSSSPFSYHTGRSFLPSPL